MVTFLKADSADFVALRQLWLTCFAEDERAADLFFENINDTVHPYKATEGEQLIAAVYLADCSLNDRQTHYLCGAATLPAYRGRGVMSGLIRFALADARARGDVFSVLYPADKGLYRFYERLGYQTKCTVRTMLWNREDLGVTQTPVCGEPDTDVLQRQTLYENFLFWKQNFIRFAAAYYEIYDVKTIRSRDAFVMYALDGGTATVYYALYRTGQDCKNLLSTIGADSYILIGTGADPLFAEAKCEAGGMVCPLTEEKPPDDVFIGITLN
ncbi:MAG: GNAT family N-acetyltransferase [Ruminococcus sp.]|nr:GNAT family N-acetyltransferase [Ruminococcus sp.]